MVIFREGDKAQSFYFIYSGSVCIRKKQNMEISTLGTLGSGEFFGELALVESNGERGATLSAKTNTTVLVLSREDFHQCLQQAPQLLSEFKVRVQGSSTDLCNLLEYSKTRGAFVSWLQNTGKMHILECYEDINEEISKQNTNMLSTFLEKYTKRTSSQFIDFPNQLTITLELEIAFLQRGETPQLAKPGTLNRFKEVVRNILECDLLPAFKESGTWETVSTLLHFYDDIDKHMMS